MSEPKIRLAQIAPSVSGTDQITGNVSISGNVGIGIAVPTSKLHVVGNANITTGINTATINVTTANVGTVVGAGALTLSTGTGSNGNIVFSANGTEYLRITNTGNVGIGTTTANVYGGGLEVSRNNGQTGIRVTDRGANGKAIEIGADPNGGYIQTVVANARIDFYTNAANVSAMTLSSTGNVGIGTATATEKFHVFGGRVRIQSGASGYGWIFGEDTNHSIIMHGDRDGTALDATNYYQYGGTLAAAKGHRFWTGGVLASQTLKLAIADDGTRINPTAGHVWAGYDGSSEAAASGYYFYVGKDWSASNHRINRQVTQGNPILVLSAYGATSVAADTALFWSVNSGGASASATALTLGYNSSTSRSLNAGGTVNASGADYAEYMIKNGDFNINKGDICGVDENGLLTNKYSEAHSFVVKSTNPSYVGGDTWGAEEAVGKKPYLTRKEDDETDEEYAERVAQHEIEIENFNIALENARKLVDRIAFSGQVPVNVLGATVGNYIIPAEGDNDTIVGTAVATPTFEEYQKAVGKVWKILEDGRALISVKVG